MLPVMKFGVMFANTGFGSSPQGATDIAKAAEAGGFDSLWTVEHVVVPSGYESQYPYDPSGKMAGGAEVFDLPEQGYHGKHSAGSARAGATVSHPGSTLGIPVA